jgi:hypothetical protein
MRGVHILGGRREPASAWLSPRERVSFIRVFSLVLVVASMLGTAACVGVTGNTATGGGATVTPSSVNFGTVPMHVKASRSLTLTNTGTADLTVTKISETGQGYSTVGGGLSANMAVKAGSSLNFSIYFSPLVAGHAPGNLSITTSADSTPLTVTLDGTGVAAPGGTPAIEVTPSSVNFGNVTVGTTDTQTMRLANTGTADLTVTKISASGTGFSESGLSIPLTLPAGQSTTFTASFKPTGTGAQTGSIAITSNASGSPLSVSLTGSGVTTNTKLSANPTSLNFGTVTVGTTDSQNVSLTNTGNTNVAISSVGTVGTGFSSTGGANATLTPNQSINVSISFNPKAPGGVTGTVTISSNAPKVQVALAGQGAGTPVPHSVTLNWAPSVSTVVGYNVYRGSVSGGPYTRLNPSTDSLTSYTDHGVSGGQTYYYVVTAIDASSIESGFSNQVSVTIPSP